MSDQNPFEVNETLLGGSQVAPYAPALIHLLQGVIDVEDEIWNLVLSYRTPIESYFAQMGLALYVNETNGYAFLWQPDLQDEKGAALALPRLTRRQKLGYSVTLLLVLIREELNQFDTTNVDSRRLLIPREALLDKMRPFYAKSDDARAAAKAMDRDINQVVDFGFLKPIKRGQSVTDYVVRPVLKAKITSDELETLHAQLVQHAASTEGNDNEG